MAEGEAVGKILDRARQIRRERDSGFGIDRDRLTQLEFEAVLLFDEWTDVYEARERREQIELMKVGFRLKGLE